MDERQIQSAVVVSPPFESSLGMDYACFVDHGGVVFKLHWSGEMQYPDMSTFPAIKGTTVEAVHMSEEMADLWARGRFIDHGANACIRFIMDDPEFPIVKFAHPTSESRALIEHEFTMIKAMANEQIPVPKTAQALLRDTDGPFGYRMEALIKTPYASRHMFHGALNALLSGLHAKGFAHGDVSPSNVMAWSANTSLVLIDCSNAGRLGDPIPAHIPSWAYGGDAVFTTKTDLANLDRYF